MPLEDLDQLERDLARLPQAKATQVASTFFAVSCAVSAAEQLLWLSECGDAPGRFDAVGEEQRARWLLYLVTFVTTAVIVAAWLVDPW